MIVNFKPAKKLIIVLIIILIGIVFLFAFLYFKEKKAAREIELSEYTTLAPFSPPESELEKTEAKDPKEGNSGKIKIELNLEKSPPEISWPEDYDILSLKLYYLGRTEETSDIFLTWSFKSSIQNPIWVPQKDGKVILERLPGISQPLAIGKMDPLMIIEIPFSVDLDSPQDKKYAIEAYFVKKDDLKNEKISKAIYGFTY